ncbi:MAG: DUF3524 domain-containing protein [Spirochaetales bacterium]|nr:DUF3524 domain-containing protein [Spirochaetales bacterium]
MKCLFLESFYGGSHKAFADAVQKHSAHEITLLTLPARHWKWRQGGSALAFADLMAERGEAFTDYDRLIVTDLSDLNLLKSLFSLPPVLLYMHESQFHYPLGPGEQPDFHYGLKDFTNMLAADRVVFNSRYHGETFYRECGEFLNKMPDFRPNSFLKQLKENYEVVYPGFTPPEKPFIPQKRAPGNPPVILWNHRWEHDKNPEGFYEFLRGLRNKGQAFKLILLGERFRRYPTVFDSIQKEFPQDIITSEYAASRKAYWELLYQSDYVVSTALQENFGISVVEAIHAGATPLLPRRLSYPEVLPLSHHNLLYENPEGLIELFCRLEAGEVNDQPSLPSLMDSYTTQNSLSRLDQILENMS